MSKRMLATIFSLSVAVVAVGCDQGNGGRAQAASAFAVALAQGGGPRAVIAAIEGHARECRAAGGRFVPGPGFDTRLTINGDEAPDHLLDYGAAECQGASEDYYGAARGGRRDDGCGRLGCRVEVWLSGRGGHQLAFGSSVWGVQVVPDVQPARLRFSAIGMPGCEASSAEGCHAEWGWNGSALVHQRWLTSEEMFGSEDSYDDDENSSIPASSGASGALPFREGEYHPIPADPEYTGSLSITSSVVRYGDTASDVMCRVTSSDVAGSRVRMTLACGECVRGNCDQLIPFDQGETWTIQAESSTVIRITGGPYGDGRYRHGEQPRY